MAKKRPWLTDALRLLDERGYTSTELCDALREKYRRNGPDPKEVTLILKRDSRFRLVDECTTSSLMRSRSHTLPVFGLSEGNYENEHPWRRL